MQTAKVATSYVVELSESDSRLVLDDWTLGERLEKLGARDIDYDGHFGPNVFFTVDVEDDTPELHTEVRRVCRERLNEI